MKTFRYIHEWTHFKTSLIFHTFPMIHIGNQKYYDEISKRLESMSSLLIEGVSLREKSELGNYTRFAKQIGLTSQFEALKISKKIPVTNIDMKKSEFIKEYRSLPIGSKIHILFLEIFLRNFKTKDIERIRKDLDCMYCYSENAAIKLIDPKNHYASTHDKKSKFNLLLENKRNKKIQENINSYIKENTNQKTKTDIGIIFGDGHMPYIYRTLLANGYLWKLEGKVNVF